MTLFRWSICLLAILVYEVTCLKVQYEGDQVLKITPKTSNQAQYMKELTHEWLLDLWKPESSEGINPGREVHVRVPLSHVQLMKEKLQEQQIPFKIMINDVQKLISYATTKHLQRISLETYDYTIYHPMNEIYHWMEEINEKHSDLVTKRYLGHTYEHRPIYYFKVGWPSDKKKKVILMDCGFHAREWVSVAFCQWFVKEILATHKDDPVLTNVLKQVDLYIIPILNIDGYIYTWTKERLWRKNRAIYNETCTGVDLNRNFDAHWCTIGASRDCSSNTFCGSEPASEPETKAMVSLVEKIKSDILGYLTFHSYGQMILLPYGYTTTPSKDHDAMMEAASRAVSKMKEKHNNEYAVGSSCLVINYFDSGSSGDWATEIGIKYSYTFELRDNGTYGFQLPEEQIKPTCEETTTAVMTMFEYFNEKYLENSAVSVTSMKLNVLLSCILCMYYVLTH
ncbi:carboxypeptidase O-like [Spea bombifrons]|uniref:carboxypeptidase O-like n=1 Tax=Spea bombifrons TaxID=233779 RepID=UPI00234A17B5|nr:carboxypeptidase O-like [Spea bombifrons]